MRRLIALVMAGMGALQARGQAVAGTSGGSPLQVYTYLTLPFCATEETTRTITHADGSATTVKAESKVERDAQGRVYREVRLPYVAGKAPSGRLLFFELADPVTNTLTDCTENNTACVVSELKTQALKVDTRRKVLSTVDLGSRDIEGVTAIGRRELVEIPASDKKKLAYQRTEETWFAKELEQNVLTITEDERDGRLEARMHITSRAAPDAQLFSIPGRYTLTGVGTPPLQMESRPGVERATLGLTPPKLLYQPEPEIPRELTKQRLSGSVLVSLIVDEKGLPTEVRVRRGFGLFNDTAVAVVKKYRFTPAMKDGLPVKVEMIIEVNFRVG